MPYGKGKGKGGMSSVRASTQSRSTAEKGPEEVWSEAPVYCYWCGRPGHVMKDCFWWMQSEGTFKGKGSYKGKGGKGKAGKSKVSD